MNATLNINGNLTLLTGGILTTPLLSAGTIIKQGGTTSQFLKANGDVDSSTYLRTGLADSTYLPLAGGTMTGTINRADQFNDGSPLTAYYNILNYFARRDNVKGNQTAQITFTDRPGTSTFQNNVRTSDIYLMTAKNFSGGQLGQYLDTTLSIVANQDGGRIGISNLNPSYKLDVNGTLGVTGATTLTGGINGNTTFNNGNVNIGIITSAGISTSSPKLITMDETFGNNTVGTNFKLKLFQDNATSTYGFGISSNLFEIVSGNTGAIAFFTNGANERMRILSGGDVGIGTSSPNAKLDVRGSVIINEGSDDFDTRIESSTNANMVFVDAGLDRVGIGTGTPSSTLSVNGSVNATDLSLTNPLPITSGGTGAESASVARSTLGVGYLFIEVTAGTVAILASNRVSLVNTGGSLTTQLDLTTATNGRMYMIKNLASGTIVSTDSNVIPFAGGSAGTAILSAGNSTPQWCILVADGTNWHIMQRN
jgi:hypothetical protein